MKKYILIGALCLATFSASARSLNVTLGSVTYSYTDTSMGDATVNGGTSITINERTYNVADITAMKVVSAEQSDNTVSVEYTTSGAIVLVAGNIANFIDASVSGAHVEITQSSLVSASTCGEITYELKGESTDGSFTLNGSYKYTLELRGLTLNNPNGAVLNIQNGKRIELSAKSGTTNILTDGTGGSQKGAIVVKGHLELKGKGDLTVGGNTAHAIYAKEYVTLKNCSVTINKSVKDGINCAQYFAMESGTLAISGVGDDGIQVDYKDDTDRDDEDTGTATISGGTLTINVTNDASKSIKTEGDINITGGTLTLSVTGDGVWDSSKSKTKASSCMSADGDVTISGGEINLTATGGGGKGISCDGTFTMSDGDLTISTTGGMLAYVNNKINTNYTGNADNLASDYKSSPKGVKADTAVLIDGGTINVTTTGNGGEGIESKGIFTVNDGTITLYTKDDCINSSSHMYLNGGTITAISTSNDGFDSNGNMYINGGYHMAFGADSPECGIDAAEEDGYTVIFTGGTLLAVGGGNSTPTKSESTQPYVSTTSSVSAGSTISLSSGSTTLATFTVPSNYSGGSSGGGGFGPGSSRNKTVMITCGGLTSGSTYTLKSDSSSKSVTARLIGTGSGRP